jgi:ribosome biogenesis GTPase / thiamine phosphate phosphatase
MAIGDIREDGSRGRHTTAHRQLVMLPCGCMIIDTPGLREVGMWDSASGLDEAFHDVTRYFQHCRFSDCRHQNEPGCAVLEAIAEGSLSQQRWDDYQKLLLETKFVNDKSDYLQSKKEWHRSISKKVRQMKKQRKH